MKFTPKVKKFQTGGAIEQSAPEEVEQMPAEQAAPQQQDPMAALVEGAMIALLNQDCQTAMQVCQALVQLVQQAAGPAPEAAQGEPVFRKGGVLVRRIKK